MQTVTGRQPLTEKQQTIYEFIRTEVNERLSQTVREIGEQFGIRSSNGVMCHLRALERKGWIQRDPYLSRGIKLIPELRTESLEFAPGQSISVGSVTFACVSANDNGSVNVEVVHQDTEDLKTYP